MAAKIWDITQIYGYNVFFDLVALQISVKKWRAPYITCILHHIIVEMLHFSRVQYVPQAVTQ